MEANHDRAVIPLPKRLVTMCLAPTMMFVAIPYCYAWGVDGKGDGGFGALGLYLIMRAALPFIAIGNLIVASKPWRSYASGILAAIGFMVAAMATSYVILASKS